MTSRQAALRRGLGELGLVLPADAHEKLLAYLELLAKWNKTYNLTAIRDLDKMIGLHLLDSLAVLRHLPAGDARRRRRRRRAARHSARHRRTCSGASR